MKRYLFLIPLLCVLMTSCLDHDDPNLAPIDTSKVKISANIVVKPTATWLNQSEEISVSVSDVDMIAPKGVVIRSISLCKDNNPVLEKPYSGAPLDFKYSLDYTRGRVNLSIIATLIQQKARDAQILIEDNIQRVVFTETPKFECEGNVKITVKSTSTAGEECNKTFEVKSIDHFTIPVSAKELYWTPTTGTASTLEVTLAGGAKAWSTNSTLESSIQRVYWGPNLGAKQEIKMTIPNTLGSLKNQNLSLTVQTVESGTWENVTVEPSNMTYVFALTEAE